MTLIFRKPLPNVEHPEMPADVVIVGGGPAGMACALRLSQLIDEHNARHPESPLSKENIYVLEKAREAGQHCLSGALLDPRSMKELLPGIRKRSAARCRGPQGSCSLPHAHRQLPASHNSSAAAGSWQLRHLHQPLCEMAGRQSRRSGYHYFHGLRRIGTSIRRQSRHRACAPTTKASTNKTSRNRISSPATT